MANKQELWTQCLSIVDGYKQIGITTYEGLQDYLNSNTKIKPKVRDGNLEIFKAVEAYRSSSNPDVKKVNKERAIKMQQGILFSLVKYLERESSRPSKKIKDKKKRKRKLSKKAKQKNR